jgi:hypothetical protein
MGAFVTKITPSVLDFSRQVHDGCSSVSSSRDARNAMQKAMSRLAARIRGRAPDFRDAEPLKIHPAIPQSFDAAQVQLVLQLGELHQDDPGQAALMLESWVQRKVFSAAQQSLIESLWVLERDDLLQTLFDCASTHEARRVIGEELLRLARE